MRAKESSKEWHGVKKKRSWDDKDGSQGSKSEKVPAGRVRLPFRSSIPPPAFLARSPFFHLSLSFLAAVEIFGEAAQVFYGTCAKFVFGKRTSNSLSHQHTLSLSLAFCYRILKV